MPAARFGEDAGNDIRNLRAQATDPQDSPGARGPKAAAFDGAPAAGHSAHMDEALRERAERRLAEAASAAGVADPRPALRERLRALRERAPDAFDRARAHYEERVLPALADGNGELEPLARWIEYARVVAGLEGEGRTCVVDRVGRATDFAGACPGGALVMQLPDDAAAPAFAILSPAEPSPAQQATLDLLVGGRLSL
jgi:hypothetical protein